MIHTVLGSINSSTLGVTLLHEHLMWNLNGANSYSLYDKSKIISTMLPYLLELKKLGCDTLVEATPSGAGRDVEVLQELSISSGLKIITCVGAWDGSNNGYFINDFIKTLPAEKVANTWINEYKFGIKNTGAKPGFIKIALGKNGELTDLQLKLFKAAIITSKETNLAIHCHVIQPSALFELINMCQEYNLALNKLVWIHADICQDKEVIYKVAKLGSFVCFDSALYKTDDYSWYLNTINEMANSQLINNLLISQDSGLYEISTQSVCSSFRSYSKLFTDVIPALIEQGVGKDIINNILVSNPTKALNC